MIDLCEAAGETGPWSRRTPKLNYEAAGGIKITLETFMIIDEMKYANTELNNTTSSILLQFLNIVMSLIRVCFVGSLAGYERHEHCKAHCCRHAIV